MVKATFIVARDSGGLRPVFGVPAARRLVLVAAGLGLDNIHVLGRDDSLRRILSDLIPGHAFHTISDGEGLSGIVGRLGSQAGIGCSSWRRTASSTDGGSGKC